MSITTKFPSQVKTFEVLFQPSATGYYIPNYQRPYSWNKGNVEQLMSDVIAGTSRLVESRKPDEEYRFLGTIITVTLPTTTAMHLMHPVDNEAVPTAVSFIVDGQQRLSTLSILAIALYDYINVLTTKINKEFKNNDTGILIEVKELRKKYQEDLTKLFALNLSWGTPRLKPIIIRADDDKWVKNGEAYKSELAKMIAKFCIHTESQIDSYKAFTVDKTNIVGENYVEICNLLKRAFEKTDTDDSDDNDEEIPLPRAKDIISTQHLGFSVLMMPCPSIIQNIYDDVISVKQFVQILALSHFLLKRCLVNHVEPQSEAWAFDMFQSLNSTGEPLTSFDIFKAVMLQRLPTINKDNIKNEIKDMYIQLDALLVNFTKEAKLRKITEIITILGLSYEGEQVSKLTSVQKQWLTDVYVNNGETMISEHYKVVIQRIRRTITFTESVRKLQESKSGFISELAGNMPSQLRDEAMFSLLFLKDAGHSIVNGVLNNALFQVIDENKSIQSMTDFCNITRAVTAFYALWWPINKTKKLPKIHRDIMASHGWNIKSYVDAYQVKQDLLQHIQSLPDRNEWINRTADKLRYGAGSDKLVKLALFVSMWSTTLHNGRLIASRGADLSSLLTASRWCSDSFASIEHIAPQTQTVAWDKEIYPEYVDRIGNLVLLPTEINSGTGNKSWKHKWIYYSHTAETDILKQKSLRETAFAHNITLDDAVVKNLQKSTYNQHLQPILQLGISYNWDKQTIEQRSRDICALLYDRMMEWLS